METGRNQIDTTGLNEAARLMQTAGSIGGDWRRGTERLAALTFWNAVGMKVERAGLVFQQPVRSDVGR